MVRPILTALAVVVVAGASSAFAQTPAPAPTPAPTPVPVPVVKKWFSSVAFGLTVTRGNTNTTTFNAGYDLKYDPRTRNILKTDGLFIRGTSGGVVSTNRLALNFRDEHQANGHFFVYAQGQFLRDPFKEIDYLVAPTAGLGLKPVETATTRLSINAGLGGVWERNTRRSVRRSGAVTIGEKLTHSLSPTVTLTQSLSALWKTENLDDALYTVLVGVTASINSRTQFKVEWIDTYKSRPPAAGIRKNDVSMIVALVIRK
jgi:putative salt-induced outer membrane protein YdiY